MLPTPSSTVPSNPALSKSEPYPQPCLLQVQTLPALSKSKPDPDPALSKSKPYSDPALQPCPLQV